MSQYRDSADTTGGDRPDEITRAGIGPEIGSQAPDLRAPSTVHQTLDLERFEQRVPVVIVFAIGLDDPATVISQLDSVHAEFGHARVQLLAVFDLPIGQLLEAADGTNVPFIADPDRHLAEQYVVPVGRDRVTVVVLDLDSTVVDVIELSVVGDLGGALGALVRAGGSPAVARLADR